MMNDESKRYTENLQQKSNNIARIFDLSLPPFLSQWQGMEREWAREQERREKPRS